MREHEALDRDIVVVADYFIPNPDHDSASLRLMHLMELLARRAQVVFMPTFGDSSTPDAAGRLGDLGIGVISRREGQLRFLEDHGTRVRMALLSRPHSVTTYLGPLRTYAPEAIVAYDTVDLHCRRLEREADVADAEQRIERFQLRADALSTRALEGYLAGECDVTVVVSENDAEGIRELVPEADVRVISNVHPASPRSSQPLASTLSFIGHYPHRPNVDAALWFIDDIMPKVLERVPQATVEFIGDAPPPELRARASAHVRVVGWADDLDDVLSETAIGVAPLRFGAGVKGKIGEMARRAIPVVSTSVGAEGMGLQHAKHILVADNEEQFAAHVVDLLTDVTRAREIGLAGCRQVGGQFGTATAARELERLLDMGQRTPSATSSERPST